MPEAPLWRPDATRIAGANLTRFMALINDRHGLSLDDYDPLYDWSVAERADFWTAIWDFCGVIGARGTGPALVDGAAMPGAGFFPDAQLNFAENLMRRRGPGDAMVFWSEDKIKRRLSHDQLHDQVSRLAQALAAAGVGPGDRVAAFMPNMPETVVAMLATTALGAVWSSCSPDFGAQGVLDRFGQIAPKVLIAVEGYHYNGRELDVRDKVAAVAAALPTVDRVVIVPHVRPAPDIAGIDKAITLADFTAPFTAAPVIFQPMAFNDPLYIMYSGTTGAPKCIVHGIGGTLLQHLKEHVLQSDENRRSFTTCGG